METRMDPCLLWARATVVGSIAFLLGLVGHVTADGLLPGPGVLVVMLAGAVLLSVPLLTTAASRPRLLVLLVGGQAANHLVLSLTAGHAGDAAGAQPPSPQPAPTLGTLPVVHGHRVGSFQDAFTTVTSADGGGSVGPSLPIGHLVDDMSAHAPMMVAHLLAAAAVALWLARGEQYLWTLLALTGRRLVLAALTTVPAPPSTTSLRTTDRGCDLVRPRSVWLVRPATRRGPPLLAA